MYFIFILFLSFFTLLPAMEPEAPAEQDVFSEKVSGISRSESALELRNLRDFSRSMPTAREKKEMEAFFASLSKPSAMEESMAQVAESLQKTQENLLEVQRAIEEERRPRFFPGFTALLEELLFWCCRRGALEE